MYNIGLYDVLLSGLEGLFISHPFSLVGIIVTLSSLSQTLYTGGEHIPCVLYWLHRRQTLAFSLLNVILVVDLAIKQVAYSDYYAKGALLDEEYLKRKKKEKTVRSQETFIDKEHLGSDLRIRLVKTAFSMICRKFLCKYSFEWT